MTTLADVPTKLGELSLTRSTFCDREDGTRYLVGVTYGHPIDFNKIALIQALGHLLAEVEGQYLFPDNPHVLRAKQVIAQAAT